ncbi:hypothetical protein FACS1894122_01730 [Alphaproteobacteria bacterium]|nr:hypothetical protein FACS1894122_01730 [Alphaproteobacteria bacterium]
MRKSGCIVPVVALTLATLFEAYSVNLNKDSFKASHKDSAKQEKTSVVHKDSLKGSHKDSNKQAKALPKSAYDPWLNALSTHEKGSRTWLATGAGEEWLKGSEGQKWLTTPCGKKWSGTEADKQLDGVDNNATQ